MEEETRKQKQQKNNWKKENRNQRKKDWKRKLEFRKLAKRRI